MIAGTNPAASDFRAADPYFSGGGVGQEFNISYALLQLIEHHVPALEQSPRVDRGFDPTRAAIEKANTESVFQAGDRFRH